MGIPGSSLLSLHFLSEGDVKYLLGSVFTPEQGSAQQDLTSAAAWAQGLQAEQLGLNAGINGECLGS